MGGERRGEGEDAKEVEAAEEAAAVSAATEEEGRRRDAGAGFEDRSFMQIGEQGRMGLCALLRGCPSAIRLVRRGETGGTKGTRQP